MLGTASDRYIGWTGQIYHKDYGKGIHRRSKKVRDQTFEEHVLPVSSVAEYFEHFEVLEIDYTFYGLLLDRERKRTDIYKTLVSYSKYISYGNNLILKAPQVITAKMFFKEKNYIKNENYLNSHLFKDHFFDPCLEILGDNLLGIIFEQEYHPKDQRMSFDQVVSEWNLFFQEIPVFEGYHIEFRTYNYITTDLLNLLRKFGIGVVLSHWTWLPSLRKQFKDLNEEVYNKEGLQVIRLMTPRNVKYEDAYIKAFPFNELKEDLMDPRMIDDTVYVTKRILSQGKRACVIINNRAGGNAPELARLFKLSFQKSIERRLTP